MVGDNVLIPGHGTVITLLWPSTSARDPSANFVSSKHLLLPCPLSLAQALHPSNSDRIVWLDSYNYEKGGLREMDCYTPINKRQYLALRRQDTIPKSLP